MDHQIIVTELELRLIQQAFFDLKDKIDKETKNLRLTKTEWEKQVIFEKRIQKATEILKDLIHPNFIMPNDNVTERILNSEVNND